MNRPGDNKPLIKTGWLRAAFYFLAILLGLAIILPGFLSIGLQWNTGIGYDSLIRWISIVPICIS